jgi:RNA polymerase sigma factor (sigma-70 family)
VDDPTELVRRAQDVFAGPKSRGDAFGALVARYQDMAYGYAYALLGDPHLAQDATQEAFLAAYRHLAQLREPEAFPGWLRRIVQTQCHRLTRGQPASIQPLDAVRSLAAGRADPAQVAEVADATRRLTAVIGALPANQRTVFVLCAIDGYAQRDVAAFLDLSIDAVKQLLRRARRRLQERMLDMARDDLRRRRPSRDDRFVRAVRLFASLEAAAEQGQVETIELMLVDGVDIDARDDAGRTVLHWAALHGHVDAIELLIERGATLTLRDAAGKTAWQTAVEHGRVAAATALQRRGAGQDAG